MFQYAKKYAFDPDDSADLAFQKQLLAIICSFLVLCGVVWWLMWFLIFGWVIPTYAAGLFGIMVFVMLFVSHYAKNHLLLVHSTFFGTMIVPVVCQWSIGHLHGGLIIGWAFLTPLGILIFSSIRPALIYMLIFLACLLITANVEPAFYGKPMEVDKSTIHLFYSMNLVTSYSVIFATCAWFVHRIKVEKGISEDLILNILPKEVAIELKKFGKVKPVSHDNATVLFTDFKGFTEISELISADELVEEINHCFGAFDEITSKYYIEKIKTIGDSYMAVGGNFGRKECTPWHVVSAAMELRDYIRNRKALREKEGKFGFEMRIGVHSGPVISGVVGVKKFQFDIWGDTVNIASRMESNGAIEEVNISEVTHELVKDDFDFEFRGQIPVKGKGEMGMYFVRHKAKKS